VADEHELVEAQRRGQTVAVRAQAGQCDVVEVRRSVRPAVTELIVVDDSGTVCERVDEGPEILMVEPEPPVHEDHRRPSAKRHVVELLAVDGRKARRLGGRAFFVSSAALFRFGFDDVFRQPPRERGGRKDRSNPQKGPSIDLHDVSFRVPRESCDAGDDLPEEGPVSMGRKRKRGALNPAFSLC
jgi:hypothetical protein